MGFSNKIWIFFAMSILISLSTVCAFESVDEYFTTWQKSGSAMQPYGEKFYDVRYETTGDYSLPDWGVDEGLLALGTTSTTISVSTHGFIKFSKKPVQFHKKRLPFAGTIREEDPKIIAAFFAESYLAAGNTGAGLYLRTLRKDDSTSDLVRKEVSNEMLTRLENEVTQNMAGAFRESQATRAIIATWSDFTFLVCGDVTCPRNTYQVAIVSGPQETYVMFYYGKLSWFGSIPAKCSPTTGTDGNGEYPECRPAQAGFNAGGGIQFFPLPGSGHNDILALASMGKLYYDISEVIPRPGGCQPYSVLGGELSHAMLHSVYPPRGNQLGDYVIHVQGLCVNNNTDVTVQCQFGGADVEFTPGLVVSEHTIACSVPLLAQTGVIDVIVKVDGLPEEGNGPSPVILPLHFISERADKPGFNTAEIVFGQQYLSSRPLSSDAQVVITWDPARISWTQPNDKAEEVNIVLYGVRRDSRGLFEMQELETLGSAQNSGQAVLTDALQAACGGTNCAWQMGALRLTVPGQAPHATTSVWTPLIPLGWYVNDAMVTAQALHDWPGKLCQDWLLNDGDTSWQNTLHTCPCTRDQAVTADGSYIADMETSDDSGETTVDCLVSTFPSVEGAGSRCCYDAPGFLLYAGDASSAQAANQQYSFSMKIHPYESLFRHWEEDILPRLWCCDYSQEHCAKYAARRPTRDCAHYMAPGLAMAYGDPHFLTFDGLAYTYNGEGTYALVDSDEFDAQHFRLEARFSRLASENGEAYKGTSITAIALRGRVDGQMSPHIQMHLADTDLLAVFVNGVRMKAEGGTTLILHAAESDNNRLAMIQVHNRGNVSVLLDSGISVSVAAKYRVIAVALALPARFKAHTNGMFGVWNNDTEDDLTGRSGVVVPYEDKDNLQSIHQTFGNSWLQSDSPIFILTEEHSLADFHDENFEPNFGVTLDSGSTVTQVCSSGGELSFACQYDYSVMADTLVAELSAQLESLAVRQQAMAAPVATCGYLAAPHCERVATHYMEGGSLVFPRAEDGYTLTGTHDYSCVREQGELAWRPAPNVQCEPARSGGDEVATAVAVVMIILLIVVAVLLFVWCHRRGGLKRSSDQKKGPPPSNHQHLSKYPDPYINEGLSQSSVSVNSTRSNRSVILTEELKAARPPRPKKPSSPASVEPKAGPIMYDNPELDTQKPMAIYENAPAENNNSPPAAFSTPNPAPQPNLGYIPPYTSRLQPPTVKTSV